MRHSRGNLIPPNPAVVHVSHSDGGAGAGRGAYMLHRSLHELQVPSKLLVRRKKTLDTNVVAPRTGFGQKVAKAHTSFEASLPRYVGDPTDIFTINMFGSNVVRQVRRLGPDLVHLHWIGYGMLRPQQIRSFGRPVVWTLRDMWPFTGGCHYDHGCGKFEARCGSCPVLGSEREWDWSRWGLRRKVRAYGGSQLHLVALSSWIAAQAAKSTAMGDFRVRVIPPGVDLAVFLPIETGEARSRLGLPHEKRLLFFPAINPLEKRKGWHLLRAALDSIVKNHERPDDAILLVAGKAEARAMVGSPMKVVALGNVEADTQMALAYSAADVTVVPSVQEAFGKVSIESLACGTPVVAFRDTGLEDAVAHKRTGYLAETNSVPDLARGISWTLDLKVTSEFRSETARRERYSASREARAYLELYRELLNL